MILTVLLFGVMLLLFAMAAVAAGTARQRPNQLTPTQARVSRIFFALCALVVFAGAWDRL